MWKEAFWEGSSLIYQQCTGTLPALWSFSSVIAARELSLLQLYF